MNSDNASNNDKEPLKKYVRCDLWNFDLNTERITSNERTLNTTMKAPIYSEDTTSKHVISKTINK